VIQKVEREPNESHGRGEVRRLTVKVPGSTANIGPGFDSLGLAFQLYCTLDFDLLQENDRNIPLITLKGKGVDHGLPKDQSNLIYTVLSNLWQNDPHLLSRIRITIESDIPLGKGLGSSAAAIMGAVWAAHALVEESIPDNSALLQKATELEGHSDNVAASLLGGLVICARSNNTRKIVTQKLTWPQEWKTLVVVPHYVLSTKRARAVLPKTIQREDAIHNVQRVALLAAAVVNKDEEAMHEALHDRLHEPYRLQLCPELSAVRRVVSDLPVIGTTLSGAGSSVMVTVHQRHKAAALEALQTWAATQTQPCDVLDLQVEPKGLSVSYE
jgi:homoserine kinase